MNILIIKDNTIPKLQYASWEKDFGEFLTRWIEKPKFKVTDHDFSFYPTEKDADNDLRPEKTWFKQLLMPGLGYDHVFVFIAEANWRSSGPLYRDLIGDSEAKGIWGTNFSYTYGDFHAHYCRWDTKSLVNIFGTSWHEMAHSFDSLIKVETGVDIRPLLGVNNYDQEVVHGTNPRFKKIRWNENTEILPKIKTHLKKAYRVRSKKFLKKRISLLNQIIELRRKLSVAMNKKDGVPKF